MDQLGIAQHRRLGNQIGERRVDGGHGFFRYGSICTFLKAIGLKGILIKTKERIPCRVAPYEHQSGNLGHCGHGRLSLTGNEAPGEDVGFLRQEHRPKLRPPGQVPGAGFQRNSVHHKSNGIAAFQLMQRQGLLDCLHSGSIPQGLGHHRKRRLAIAPVIQHGQEKIMLCGNVLIPFGIFHHP